MGATGMSTAGGIRMWLQNGGGHQNNLHREERRERGGGMHSGSGTGRYGIRRLLPGSIEEESGESIDNSNLSSSYMLSS